MLPLLPFSDDELFPALNAVMLGYACLILFPSWKYTSSITLGIVLIYSLVYALLLVHRIALSAEPLPGISFDSLDAIVTLFADRAVIFAGEAPRLFRL